MVQRYRATWGFSLIELLMVVSIISILAALAIPSFQDAQQKRQLKGAVEHYIGQMKLAHTEALKRNNSLFLSILPGADWCYGLSDIGACDCSAANQCTLSGVETTFDNADYPDVVVTVNGFTLSGGQAFVSFEPVRGTSNHTGSTTFTLGNRSVVVSITRLGLVSVCSDQMDEYGAC